MIELVPQLRKNDRIDSDLNIYMTTRGYSLGLSLKIHPMSLLTVPLAIVRRIPHGVTGGNWPCIHWIHGKYMSVSGHICPAYGGEINSKQN